jgi:2-(1,2-epoxy-1,2-dihydrophenyl)acetyl-CoA isomerase
MADSLLLIDHAEGVLTLTLNRPEKLNALVLSLYDTLREVFAQVRQDAAVGAVVLTGKGRAFCSGQDIAEFPVSPSDASCGRWTNPFWPRSTAWPLGPG